MKVGALQLREQPEFQRSPDLHQLVASHRHQAVQALHAELTPNLRQRREAERCQRRVRATLRVFVHVYFAIHLVQLGQRDRSGVLAEHQGQVAGDVRELLGGDGGAVVLVEVHVPGHVLESREVGVPDLEIAGGVCHRAEIALYRARRLALHAGGGGELRERRGCQCSARGEDLEFEGLFAARSVSAGAREPGELREGQRGEGGVSPYVDRRRGDQVRGREGRDGGGGHPQVSSQGLDAGEVQGCRLCVLVEDDVHAVELAVAVHRDAAVGGAIAALFEIRHATRRGACGTLTVDGVDGDGRERKGDEREKRHARHGAWRRRSGHARAFYWRHSSDEDHEARVKKSELGDEQL